MAVQDIASQEDMGFIGDGNNLDHYRVGSPKAQLDQESWRSLQNASERSYVHRTEPHEFQLTDDVRRHGSDVGSRVDLAGISAEERMPSGRATTTCTKGAGGETCGLYR